MAREAMTWHDMARGHPGIWTFHFRNIAENMTCVALALCCTVHATVTDAAVAATVGAKNSATPYVFAFFAEFRATSNFGRNFRLLWIFGFFGFFVNVRCFLMILLLNFDVHHSAGHLG